MKNRSGFGRAHEFAVAAALCTTLSSAAFASNDNDCTGPVGPGIGYQTAAGSYTIHAIDTRKNEIRDTLFDPGSPSLAIVTPDQRSLFVNDWGSASVGIVDVCTWRFVKHVSVGGSAFSAMSPDGKRLYAAANDKIYVFDTHLRSVVTTWTIPNQPFIIDLKVTSDNRILWMGTVQSQLIGVSTATGQLIAPPINNGSVPAWITTSPDNKLLYGGNGNNTVTFWNVSDPNKPVLVNTVVQGPDPTVIVSYLEVTPDGKQLWSANPNGMTFVMDAHTGTILRTITTTGAAWVAVPTPDGKRVYLSANTDAKSTQIPSIQLYTESVQHTYSPTFNGMDYVYSTESLEQIASFPTGISPGNVSFPSLQIWAGRDHDRD